MIGKKIRNPRKSSRLGTRVQQLANYIDQPEHASPNTRAVAHTAKAARVEGLADYAQQPTADDVREKCIYSGARGFQTSVREAQKAEMLALAQESAHSKDPINHYVLSWQQGEQPTPAQVEEAVDLFLDELGLTGHQLFYGLHADTDNVHLHLMVNRMHPVTRKAVEINQGFDLEALHRAVARIEHVQGWRRETRGRYRVAADSTLQRVRYPDHPQAPLAPARNRLPAHASGVKSAAQIARETGAALIRAAPDWASLHEHLARQGMRYARTGSGAVLWVGEIAVKASRAGRDCSLKAVERRLGDYQPAPVGLAVAVRPPEPVQPAAPRWDDYRAARDAYYRTQQAERTGLAERHRAERQALTGVHRAQRDALFQSQAWRGRGAALNGARSVLAARQAAERAALRERQWLERARFLERWRLGFLVYAEWLNRQTQSLETLLTQRRARIISADGGIDDGKHGDPAVGAEGLVRYDIRAFVAVVYTRRVDYRHQEATDDRPAFVDRGREIVITDPQNREGVLAALQLAGQKWGAFRVEGDAEYQALCVQLAARHGLRLGNPELQDALRQARLTGGRCAVPVSRPGEGGLSPSG